ncbi:myosin light chain kinase, smooth muscle [Gouania willdenowi]|uniref:Myosin light chain kinase, smooth muscle-like n=1 Tax=Gouania willdenowi TaxID=441366 RepID=A0A8C5D2S8_GOUWI|nr:myosin light chain kinase, smooth muscle-like [Gouania willdenowi]
MSADGNKQRYVSTFMMYIKPPQASSAHGKETKSTGIKSSAKCTDTGSPVFIKPLKDCTVNEGCDITLQGVLSGSHPVKVSWLHNGQVARFGKPSFNGSDVSFVVKECLPEDAGAYTCIAESSAGKTSCSAAVFVNDYESLCGVKNDDAASPTSPSKDITANGKSPHTTTDGLFKGCTSEKQSPISSPREIIPKKRINTGSGPVLQFENPPELVEVEVGQIARLTCCFSCTPPVVSCWVRNKAQVVEGADLWTESTDRSSSLVIADAQPQHTGRYTVVVKDRKSSAQHTITLSVVERPEPPSSSPVISEVSPSSLVLSWSGPCFDGGSAILGYILEVKNQKGPEPGEWKELTAQCKSTSYKVSSGLRLGQEYCFRVKAYNKVGKSGPSPESPVVKMEPKGQEKKREEEVALTYDSVTIDSCHKVTDHYHLQEKLGTGKFGLVFKLTHKETGRVCAGKFYKGRRSKEREAARKEIDLMNYLHHPKLVQCLAAYDHKPEMVMVMEFIAGGELFERIVDDNFEHTEPASVRYMQQILEGVGYMHEQSIVHLDLKPENIVCVDSTGTSIKIIDFGLACKLDGITPLKVMQGTPEFVAPEVINFDPVCLSTDMWSIGVICYILLSGESPFQGNSDVETLALVTAAQWEFDEDSFDEITEEAKNFISSLLKKDTRRRMSCKEALAHPWMATFDSGDLATTSKSLSKEKMKRFLAKQKWKKAGKALLALKRMALLSKGDSCCSPTSPREVPPPLSPENEHVLQTLEHRMQGPPMFTEKLKDQTEAPGSNVHLSCHLTGYPDPEVVWLCGEQPVEESPTVQINYEEDGRCTLVLTKVSKEDTNVYTCRATNEHGEAFCSATLLVQ